MADPQPDPAPRLPLNKPRLVRAAVDFADANGIEALSMRGLAKDLGFGVMSLYTHVANKDEMIEAMVDLVADEIELPTDGPNWQELLLASAASAHEVLLRHPWVVTEWLRRTPGPARLRYMEWILATLTDGGVPPSVVYHGYHAVTMHIIGFTQQQLSFEQSLGGADLETLVAGFLESGVGDTYPHLADHARAHVEDDHGGDEFGYVLRLILDGLGRAAADA